MDGKSVRGSALILGALLAIGLLGAGYFVSNTLYKAKLANNSVTVKGFAEREVKADLALWQITYSVTGGGLPDVYARSRANQATIVAFLAQRGFKPGDIRTGNLDITDLMANPDRSKSVTADQRYIVKNTISVRSDSVDRVDAASRQLNDLLQNGIILTANSVDYEFTRLGDIKAPMLRAATQNARDAADQFAHDAGSKVGSIQNASQGFFSIVSRDAAASGTDNENNFSNGPSTIDKRVRVVVTLTYYLVR